MGFSSFWASIKGPRGGKAASEKHHDDIYAKHHKVPPNNTHAALSNAEVTHGQPARVDSASAKKLNRKSFIRSKAQRQVSNEDPTPLLTPSQKQLNRRSGWQSESQLNAGFAQLDQPPDLPSNNDEAKKAKRRSLWRSQSEAKLQRPDPSPITGTQTSSSTPDKKAKRRSFWRTESQNKTNEDSLIDRTAAQPSEDGRPRKLSRGLSTSSKRSRRSSRSRLSIFGGAADLDSDDDVPAMPAIPHAHMHEQRRDQGSSLGMPEYTATPNTVLASNDTTAPASTSKPRRFSLSRQKSTASTKSKKNRRSSWLPSSSNPIDSRTPSSSHSRSSTPPPPIPAMPALTPDSQTSSTKDPFENFLLNSHRYSRHTNQPYHDLTDFDRFLKETAAFEALGLRAEGTRRKSVKAPKDTGRPARTKSYAAPPSRGLADWDTLALRPMRTRDSGYNKPRGSYMGPRSAERGFLSSTTDLDTRRESWRRSYHQGDDVDMRDPMYCLQNGRSEWEELMMKNGGKVADENGVMGMLRDLADDDGKGSGGRDDALKALECGVAR